MAGQTLLPCKMSLQSGFPSVRSWKPGAVKPNCLKFQKAAHTNNGQYLTCYHKKTNISHVYVDLNDSVHVSVNNWYKNIRVIH